MLIPETQALFTNNIRNYPTTRLTLIVMEIRILFMKRLLAKDLARVAIEQMQMVMRAKLRLQMVAQSQPGKDIIGVKKVPVRVRLVYFLSMIPYLKMD